MKFQFCFIAASIFASVSIGWAQDSAQPRTQNSVGQTDAQATLPEIEVRPPDTTPIQPQVDPLSGGQSSLPPSNLSPSTNMGDTPSLSTQAANVRDSRADSTQNEITYSVFGQPRPSLRSQVFGNSTSDIVGLNNALRSESNVFDIPQLATIIDRELLDARQSSTMFRALQGEVGILLQQTGNGQLSPFIRGLTGQQVLLLVDGIRMNTSVLRAGPNQYTATIDPGMIERIEVIRGADSAMWGSDAIGGAINVITRSADPRRGEHVSPFFSQFYSTAEASTYTRSGFGGWYGKTGIIGGVSYLDTGNLDIGGGLGRQPATDYEQYAADLKIQRILGEDHLLTFAFQHFEQEDLKRSDRFLPFVLGPAPNGSVPIQRPTFFDPQQRDLMYCRLEGLLDESFTLADAYSITLNGTRTKEGSIVDRYPDNSLSSVANRREIGEFDDWDWGAIVAASKETSEFGRFTLGSDFYGENIDSVRTRITNPNNPNAVPIVIDPQYPDDAQANRVGAFLSWNVLLTDRLDMTTSTRYENIDLSGTPRFDSLGLIPFTRTYQDWIGSVGLSYQVNDQFRLIGGVYEGFRAPTLDDLTANKTSLQNSQSIPLVGNLAAQPEQSLTYEAGFKMDTERWRMQLVEFWTDFDSFLAREIISNNEFLTNQQAYINGTELYGEYLINRDVALYGNFFYTYGEFTSSQGFISRIPPTQGYLGLRFQKPIRKSYVDIFTWMVQRADRYNEANLSDVRFIQGGTPGYATLNLRTGKSFGYQNRDQVSLSLENITDKYYRVLGSGVDGAGFNATLGYQHIY